MTERGQEDQSGQQIGGNWRRNCESCKVEDGEKEVNIHLMSHKFTLQSPSEKGNFLIIFFFN